LHGKPHQIKAGEVVGKVMAGGIFGEMASLTQMLRTAPALAEAECQVLAVNSATFLNLVRGNPDFGLVMLNTIGERLRNVACSMK
jgi:CRP-like cAMP-binding protein